MALITSYDQILSLLDAGEGQEVFFSKQSPSIQTSGAFHTSWAHTGITAAGAWQGAGGAAAATLVSASNVTPGAIPLVSPTTVSGKNPRLLTVGAMSNTSVAGTVMLIDRIADTGALTTGAGGTCTLTMPVGGWPRHTNGVGVMAFLESLGGAPSAGTVATLSYTNTAAVAGRVSSSATTTATTHSVFGSVGAFIALQGSDNGVRWIESGTIAGVAALNVALVVCRPILMIPCVTANVYIERDLVIQTPKIPKLPVAADTTSCLQWIYFAGAATTPTLTGSVSAVNA